MVGSAAGSSGRTQSSLNESDRVHSIGSVAVGRPKPTVSIEDNPVKILSFDDDIRRTDFDGPENQHQEKKPSLLSKGKHIFKKLSR